MKRSSNRFIPNPDISKCLDSMPVSVYGPEKLVICVDYTIATNSDFKKVFRSFLDLKILVNRHEIALAVFNTSEVYTSEFQTDIKMGTFSNLCEKVRYKGDKTSIDLNRIFAKVYNLASAYKNEDAVLRVLILYGQIDAKPVIEVSAPLESLQRDFPYFFLDVLYMPSYSQNCSEERKRNERQGAREIMKFFVDICNEKSLVLAVENLKELTPQVLKFLAHPALRGLQKADRCE